jgi:hypothetical protein
MEGREKAVVKWLGIWEAGKGQLEIAWEYRRLGKGIWKVAGNIGGRERAGEKRLGMEEAGKGQLDRDWEWRRQGRGNWKVAGNI